MGANGLVGPVSQFHNVSFSFDFLVMFCDMTYEVTEEQSLRN
jgi:hypothetical protein